MWWWCWLDVIFTALVSTIIAVLHWWYHSEHLYWMGYLHGKTDEREDMEWGRKREAAKTK